MTDRLLDYEGWATQQIHDLQREVERLRGMMEKDSIRTREHNVLVQENRRLRDEVWEYKKLAECGGVIIATLREAVEEVKPILKEARFTHCYSILDKALAVTETPQ